MGLFDSKKKIQVFSTAAGLVEPDEHAAADAVLQAILSRKSISYSVINTILTGMGVKTDQMRRYAKDHYTLGLSQGGLHTSTMVLDDTDVADIIATDLSLANGVLVNYNYFTSVVFTALVQAHLHSNRGYNSTDGSITIFPSGMDLPTTYQTNSLTYTVTVTDFELVSTTEGSIDYLIQSSYTDLTRTYDQEFVGLPTYKIINRPDTIYTEIFDIPVGFYPGREYLVAAYYELDGSGTPSTTQKYWYYHVLSDKYPSLTPAADIDEANNTMPVIPIRYENARITGDLQVTGAKLLKRMKINWDDLVEKLEDNPNIADIDHAYIMFGVDLQSPTNAGCQYLTEFFDYIADLCQLSPFDNTANTLTQAGIPINYFEFTGQDIFDGGVATTSLFPDMNATVVNAEHAFSLIEYGLRVAIYFNQITSCIKTGTIGDIGTSTMSTTQSLSSSSSLVEFDHTKYRLSLAATAIFRHQITTNAYKEVTVYGLFHRNSIYKGHEVVTELDNVLDSVDEHNFIIPIHYAVSKKLQNFDRKLLYEESMQLVINGYEVTHVKWYTQNWFKFVVYIIVVILIIYNLEDWAVALLAFIKAGTAVIIKTLLMNILIGTLISEGFKLIAEMVGPELLAIFGVVIAIFSFYISPGSSFKILGQTMVTAKTVLSLAMASFSAAQKQITNLLEDIGAQYEEFLVSSEADTKQLEEAQALLKPPELLVYNLLATQNTAYVSHPLSGEPNKFYDSTIHSGNIGTLVLNVIPNYVDLAVKLPKPNIYAFGNNPNIV